MTLFIKHELEKKQNGNVLTLYLSQNGTEFSSELGTVQASPENFQNSIQTYITNNIPDIRVKTIKIMLGTLMVASFTMIGGKVLAAPIETAGVKVGEKDKRSSYVVQTGDTLFGIAKRFSMTVEQLKQINNLTSDVIKVGQQLIVPEAISTSTQSTPVQMQTTIYTVMAGDTLYSIAKKVNASVDQIKEINMLSTDFLKVGQKLNVPASSAASSKDDSAQTQTANYIVNAGDTLYSISKKYNVSLDLIKKDNNLTSNVITIGQILKVPSNTIPKPESNTTVDPALNQLHKLGYLAIQTSAGANNPAQTEAIKSFQEDYGLPVNGMIDPATKTEIEHAIVKKALVEDTSNYLGVPYLWSGTTTKGFDCSGFVYFMFKAHDVNIARTTSGSIYLMGKAVSKDKLQPGDLVFFDVNHTGKISHVGFYVGNNNYISATSSKGIAVNSLDSTYWSKYYVGAKRVY
jgi:peptidoglycan endopeptidase LytF